MKAEELMIGDYIQVNDEVCKVISISYFDIGISDNNENFYREHIDNIKPIPLTSEILVKNGFQQISTNKYVSGKVTIAIFAEEFLITIKSENARVMMITIKYIHELQHILKICGIDK